MTALKQFLTFAKSQKFNIYALRGYQNLPSHVATDLDIYAEEDELFRFISRFAQNNCPFNLQITDRRFGLVKILVSRGTFSLEIDAVYTFRFAGLEYYDPKSLIENSIYDDKRHVYTPTNYDELTIFLLKEILHNGRLPKRKVNYVHRLFENYHYLPASLMSNASIEEIVRSVRKGSLSFQKIRVILILKLLKLNVSKFGIPLTCCNVLKHLVVKFTHQIRP